MKFYATIEPYTKIKKSLANLTQFYTIDVDHIISQLTLDPSKCTHRFIISAEIGRLIKLGMRSKRYAGILYINSKLGYDAIKGVKSLIEESTTKNIDEYVLLDDFDAPKMKEYYSLFDEVIFITSLKKTKILQCVTPSSKKK